MVRVRGDCDLTTATQLRERLLDMLAWQSATMVLDLSGVDFLDCAGVRALLAASRRAELLGGMLVVAAPSPQVARLFQLTGLDHDLTVRPGIGTALAAAGPACHDSGGRRADRARHRHQPKRRGARGQGSRPDSR